MTKHQVLFTAGLAFFLGCASAPFIVPPLSAQQAAAGVQRWEVQCVENAGGPGRRASTGTTIGSQMGAAGWELVSTPDAVMCFKRPVH